MSRNGAEVATAEGAPGAVDALAEEVFDWRLAESPVSASYLGDPRGDDGLDERGPEARRRREEAARGFLARLGAMPPAAPGSAETLTQGVLERILREGLEGMEHALWEWDVDQIFGLHVLLQNVMSFQRLRTPEDGRRLGVRLARAPRAFLQWEDDLRAGLASGRVPPRLSVTRTIGQLEAFVAADPAATPFGLVLGRVPSDWPASERSAFERRHRAIVSDLVVPAYRRLLAFLREEVLPRAREAVGLWSVPGGEAAYAWLCRKMTTTDLSPDEIHRIGLEELERNTQEMLEVARDQGYRGDLKGFLETLRADARWRLATPAEILDRYRAICARMDAELPRAFATLPPVGYEIRAIEPFRERDCPAAFYQRPHEDGSRPGVFYANTYDPPSWPTYDFEPLCYHEAVPGHHLQISIAQAVPGLPRLRRHEGATAYVEGWAHYAERLADEMGMYSTPVDRVGMFSAQAWRAARLVVDTGMHHRGWTRERALEVLESVRSGPRVEAENEVDRYAIWPGQALAYKIGQRTITRLREDARVKMGARFDLRAFHDAVLRQGALPLDILEGVVRAWASAPTD